MGLVTTININTVTVRDAIGESVTAVAASCDSGKVNMFSKYKPISFNKVVGLEEADYAAASYGLVIPSLSNPKNTSGRNWAYNRPGSYGRRLGDFRNYYHDAPIPLKQVKGTTDIEAWNSAFRAIEFGASSISGATESGQNIYLNSNAYYDGEWKYKYTNTAGNLYIFGNSLFFRQAASGTVDTAITWSTPFQINASGNTGLGVSPSERLHANGNIRADGDIISKGGRYELQDSSGNLKWSIRLNSSTFEVEFYNSSGVKKAWVDQDGNLKATGELTAYSS